MTGFDPHPVLGSAASAAVIAKVEEIAASLGARLALQGYAGRDPYQLDGVATRIGQVGPLGSLVRHTRAALKPLHPFVPNWVFAQARRVLMAQALGDILHAEGLLAGQDAPVRVPAIVGLLDGIASPYSKNLAWGLPFAWAEKQARPAGWPAAVTTGKVISGLLASTRFLNRSEVAGRVRRAARFLTEECGMRDFGADGSLIRYRPGDETLIVNGSAVAAKSLAEVDTFLGEPEHEPLIRACARFIARTQNPDGSWHYAPAYAGEPADTIIDNRHTGYVIEGLATIQQMYPSDDVRNAIERGWGYVEKNLIDGNLPRWGPDQTWPIDSHDVAQLIVTALSLNRPDLAERFVRTAIEYFYLGEGRFAYKLFANGRRNETAFIRWTEAPFYRALGLFVAGRRGSAGLGALAETV